MIQVIRDLENNKVIGDDWIVTKVILREGNKVIDNVTCHRRDLKDKESMGRVNEYDCDTNTKKRKKMGQKRYKRQILEVDNKCC